MACLTKASSTWVLCPRLTVKTVKMTKIHKTLISIVPEHFFRSIEECSGTGHFFRSIEECSGTGHFFRSIKKRSGAGLFDFRVENADMFNQVCSGFPHAPWGMKTSLRAATASGVVPENKKSISMRTSEGI